MFRPFITIHSSIVPPLLAPAPVELIFQPPAVGGGFVPSRGGAFCFSPQKKKEGEGRGTCISIAPHSSTSRTHNHSILLVAPSSCPQQHLCSGAMASP